MSKASGLPISEIVARVATSGKPSIRFEGIDDESDGSGGGGGDKMKETSHASADDHVEDDGSGRGVFEDEQ